MFVTDLDGTLLTSERTPHGPGSEALRLLQSAGVTVCLASGRAVHTMRPIAEQIGLSGPLVSSNGAFVVDRCGNVVHDVRVSSDQTVHLLEFARQHGVHVNLYVDDTILVTKSGWECNLYESRTGCRTTLAGPAETQGVQPQKVLFVDTPDRHDSHRAALTGWAASHGLSVVVSEPEYLEFLPNGVNKGAGLKILADHMGLEPREIAAIGDWTNDLEMVAWAGFSAAVGNAHESVRSAARILVASNDDGGVHEFAQIILGSGFKV